MHDENHELSDYLNGERIAPSGIRKGISAADLIDEAFLAYNGGARRRWRGCWCGRSSSPT